MRERDLKYSKIIGIQSDLPGYQFCWSVNEALDVNFVRQPDFDMPFSIKKEEGHCQHLYKYNANGHTYSILKLAESDKKAISKTSQFDYLWVVQSMNCELEANNIAACLNAVADVKKAEVVPDKKNEAVMQLLVA